MAPRAGRTLSAERIIGMLAEARDRTLTLLASVPDEELLVQHDPLMSPLVWDVGHIGHFEEIWLLGNLGVGRETYGPLHGIFDPSLHPRSTRAELPLPGGRKCRAHVARIRERVVALVRSLDLGSDAPLVRDGYVFRMVVQHEYQHNETILQTLQLKRGDPYRPPRRRPHPDPGEAARDTAAFGDMVRFPGGRVEVGTDDRSAAYDNERPRHSVELAPFLIDAAPVTEEAYSRFVDAGGYGAAEHWSAAGRAWLRASGARAPRYWRRAGTTWKVRVMDRVRPLDARRPVCHVCFHEAEAYARYAGKRLPTEAEWEAAATWDPSTGSKRSFPWGEEEAHPGRANLDALGFDTAPVGSYPENVSPVGCYGMIGDVWEWTSSEFLPYPGFRAFPYPEYSEVFFGDGYRVLRGGAWATRPGAIRGTFRNWDLPVRRQIFSGFRCARDI